MFLTKATKKQHFSSQTTDVLKRTTVDKTPPESHIEGPQIDPQIHLIDFLFTWHQLNVLANIYNSS